MKARPQPLNNFIDVHETLVGAASAGGGEGVREGDGVEEFGKNDIGRGEKSVCAPSPFYLIFSIADFPNSLMRLIVQRFRLH